MPENEAIEIIKYASAFNKENTPLEKALDMAMTALGEIRQYREIGTVEECRKAVEKQTPVSRIIIEGQYFCPKCKNLMRYPGYCGCGQRVY